MRFKNVKLEWYAFRFNMNTKKIEFINVLACREKKIANAVKVGSKAKWKPVYNYETFKDFIKRELMYHYWCKFEYETVIGVPFQDEKDKLEKIDIWWQLEPNLDRICEYIISEMDIDFGKKKKSEV